MQSVSCLGFYEKSLETINTLTNISVLTVVLQDLKEKGTQEVLDKTKVRNGLQETEIEIYIYIYILTFIKPFLCCLFTVDATDTALVAKDKGVESLC